MADLDLLRLFDEPIEAAKRAAAVRDAAGGRRILVVPSPPVEPPAVAAIVRNDSVIGLDCWPTEGCEPGDLLIVHVPADPASRERYATWLSAVRERLPAASRVAPFSREPAALHRLWCVAATRLALPTTVHVEVRHDLIDIRLAQIALGFGADRLAGPVEPDRVLPLAGVTRPSETTRAGLSTLVSQAGLQPVLADATDTAPVSPHLALPHEERSR